MQLQPVIGRGIKGEMRPALARQAADEQLRQFVQKFKDEVGEVRELDASWFINDKTCRCHAMCTTFSLIVGLANTPAILDCHGPPMRS